MTPAPPLKSAVNYLADLAAQALGARTRDFDRVAYATARRWLRQAKFGLTVLERGTIFAAKGEHCYALMPNWSTGVATYLVEQIAATIAAEA